jgi:hypothetical protein
LKATALFLLTVAVCAAQIGVPNQYPGQRGPLPGTGGGLPIPRRSQKTTTSKEPGKVLPSFAGTLKRLDAKSVVVEMDDFRVLDFRRTDKTKFLKNGEAAKETDFKVGDRITVEGAEAADATLTAVNVHWEKKGTPLPPGQASDSATPTEAQLEAAEKVQAESRGGTEVKPPPAAADPEDPGPPKLQRGKPAPRKPAVERDDAPAAPAPAATAPPQGAAQQTAAVVEPPTLPPAERVAPSAMQSERISDELPNRREDPAIKRAQETALEFTETLPNYMCQEMVTRFSSEVSPPNWQPHDVVSVDVVYEGGKEDYRNQKINGKPVKKGTEESSGAWSTGEFGTILVDLFSPATGADFRFRRESRASGVTARMYEFEVQRENSHWLVHTGSQQYRPAYRGAVWIDPKTFRVLRIEMQSRNMPAEFPLDKVESATDYEYVRLGGTQQFLLPVHAETLSCQRGTSRCSRNVIDFRNYHKYTGESNIQFEKAK